SCRRTATGTAASGSARRARPTCSWRASWRWSSVNQPAVGRACGFHDAFREGRVAVDHAGDFGVAALDELDVDELLDELGGLGADDVAAEQLAVLLVAHELDEAGAVA